MIFLEYFRVLRKIKIIKKGINYIPYSSPQIKQDGECFFSTMCSPSIRIESVSFSSIPISRRSSIGSETLNKAFFDSLRGGDAQMRHPPYSYVFMHFGCCGAACVFRPIISRGSGIPDCAASVPARSSRWRPPRSAQRLRYSAVQQRAPDPDYG